VATTNNFEDQRVLLLRFTFHRVTSFE